MTAMFAKINQYLITRYPLLWNTRIAFVLPVALLIHLFFYAAGYSNDIDLKDLSVDEYFRIEVVVLFSCLVTALLVIFWLIYYLRNNPFKSFYTVSRNYLFCEFLLIFLVFFSSNTFFLTYQQSLYDRVERNTRHVDLEKEANLFNLASRFLPTTDVFYRACESCDSALAKEEWWQNEGFKNKGDGKVGRYEAYLPYYPCQDDSLPRTFLNYCQQMVHLSSEENLLDEFQLNAITRPWLTEGKRDSVLQLLEKTWLLCDTYGATYSVSPQEQTAAVFADSAFEVTKWLGNYQVDNLEYPDEYVDIEKVKGSLSRIDETRMGFWDKEIWMILIYTAFCMGIFLFSFRATRLKNWFIAIIGVGIWSILIALVMVNVSYQYSDQVFPAILMGLFVVFVIYLTTSVRNKNNKLIAGVVLNWVIWLLPAILPLLWTFLIEVTEVECYQGTCPDTPFHDFLRWNWSALLWGNLAVVILSMYLWLIPVARRWQANPEE